MHASILCSKYPLLSLVTKLHLPASCLQLNKYLQRLVQQQPSIAAAHHASLQLGMVLLLQVGAPHLICYSVIPQCDNTVWYHTSRYHICYNVMSQCNTIYRVLPHLDCYSVIPQTSGALHCSSLLLKAYYLCVPTRAQWLHVGMCSCLEVGWRS
jgi:hypothetical protein